MTRVDLSLDPFHDDYDPSKEYSQILARPGYVEQSREFTQVQTMFKNFLRGVGDSLLKDGAVVDGCSIVIDANAGTATVTDGKIYLEGLVRSFTQQTVSITQLGVEVIGVKVNQEVITEAEDTSLLDPAVGYSNFSLPGAHRLKETVELVVDDSEATALYQLKDGILDSELITTDLTYILELLARRTYDESGNYKVNGLELVPDTINTDADNIYTILESGKAYIRGYEVNKSVSIPLLIPKSKTTRSRTAETKQYLTGTLQYKLINQPVNTVGEVRATVQKTVNKTRGGSAGGIDYLPDTSITSIVSITEGATTYTPNTDYILDSDGVSWAPAGIEPASGETYSVTYQYTKVLVLNTDYKLTVISNDTYIDFTGMTGDVPVNLTSMQIDYSFYLARQDIFGLNRYGEIILVSGQPDIERLVSPPVYSNPDVLKLGTVICPANSGTPRIINYATTRVDMDRLNKVLNRIEQIEYNQAISDLDNEAIEGQQATELRGVLTDGFIGFTKSDLSHDDYDCVIDVQNGYVSLPLTSVLTKLNVKTEDVIGNIFNDIITPPLVENVGIAQALATKAMLINPYAVFNDEATIALSPSVDNWVDDTNIIIENSTMSTQTIRVWWNRQNDGWYDAQKQALLEEGYTATTDPVQLERIRTATQKILDEAITFMRQITVTITGSKFTPFEDNLELLFDNQSVAVSADPAYTGTNPNTAKADANGAVVCTFTIPSGVRTGTRQVVLKNANVTAETSFTAEGRKRTFQTTQTTDRVVFRQRVVRRSVDPLAQTFSFTEDTLVTAVDLYFAVKDPVNPITVQIRNTVNGYPGDICYAEKVIAPALITVSANSSVATKVVFDDPVLSRGNEVYSLVVMTESNVDALWIAELGKRDRLTSRTVVKQPYTTGVMFSSSNAFAWSAHQTADLKFKIYKATFTGAGTIPFNPLVALDSNQIVLVSDFVSMGGTKCEWEVKVGTSEVWEPISTYDLRELTAVTNALEVRAKLGASGGFGACLSKSINNLIGIKNKVIGYYVTRNVEMVDEFNSITQVLDVYAPTGTSFLVQYATDIDGAVWGTPNQSSEVDLGEGWKRYTYTASLGLGDEATNYRARIKFETTNPAIVPKAKRFINILKSV